MEDIADAVADWLADDRMVLPAAEMAGRIAAAAVLGALIGFEREAENQEAGLRTHMLTAIAAGIFTLIALEFFHRFSSGSGGALDPIRVVEAVTAGVAFLAAGAIIQGRGRVRGLTTGAGMWLAGAVGVASGAGLYRLAVTGTGVALLVLFVVKLLVRPFR